MLKYPNDRVDGHVLLRNGEGLFFVPDFKRCHESESDVVNAIRYCRAFLILANRVSGENHGN